MKKDEQYSASLGH